MNIVIFKLKYCLFFLFCFVYSFYAQTQSEHFSHWSSIEINQANTAIDENYLSKEEKNIFLYLNLARINPKLFSKTILKNYQVPSGFSDECLKNNNRYITSLHKELKKMSPIEVILPNRELWEYAKCHAIESGERGYIGHRRRRCDSPDYYSECCSYGFNNAIDIVIQLLIDYQVSNLGHRKIMLDPGQKLLGVSIEPHKQYSYNAVMDFSY